MRELYASKRLFVFFFSSRRRHTRYWRDWSSDVCSSDLLLMTAAVHHHLVRQKTRMEVGLVVESGDCREVHHVALLLGYGAAAVNPYLAFESIEDLIRDGNLTGIQPAQAVRNVVKALGKGVLKVMSKMGISTVGSYTMAQIFEAVGLSQEVVDEYFTGTSCPLGGVGIDVLAEEVAIRHRRAYPENPTERAHRRLETGGEYQRSEEHTSELQSRQYLVCRLLLEKKNKPNYVL